ncbi:hypothetical protein DEJ16_09670 [Curtobacterium sp. MCJR17_055]|uniref:type II toxin-antitoxin system PemK/MazF family toxin n=1 Tax=unclassified Curtobacterium TaxID=257496 RepID=UPI000D8303F8|nr:MULTISPECIES: type II toxin-antitoxin system PemK/MazF family toxin [unclassified Curtobacterium]PYY32720.1 hypothetical protein DEI87_14255 [Curtobacterium sp. MCBD17_029]PYY55745.1 hypothetical protein DEJ16_09670 [Curtobacterium sp. MCJR17_055]PYY60488.1 hypothetical protein DEJ26_06790 [Curtobacterium sp. MCPF17_015]WIB34940.1 type II toxin-antitoxin system PemK/MazF family toxin [Curtobacterium sp. MCJR17_043]
MQQDWLLASDIATVLVVPLTSDTALEAFRGNVFVPRETSGSEKDSVAVVSQIGPVSREYLDPYPAGRLPTYLLREVGAGARLVTGICSSTPSPVEPDHRPGGGLPTGSGTPVRPPPHRPSTAPSGAPDSARVSGAR